MHIISALEVTAISLRVILIISIISITIYLFQKTAGKLKKMLWFAMISLIPTIIYSIGRMLGLEASFTAGKLVGLTLNLMTTTFWLFAVLTLNSMVNDLNNKKIEKNRKVNKEIKVSSFIKKR